MSSVTVYRQEHFVKFCNQCLEEAIQDMRGLEAALIATPDGFTITYIDRKSQFNADKLSAVSSSVFALSASLVTEFSMRDCHSIMINSETGTIHVTTISAKDEHLILVIEARSDTMLAAVIHAAKKIRQAVEQEIINGILENTTS